MILPIFESGENEKPKIFNYLLLKRFESRALPFYWYYLVIYWVIWYYFLIVWLSVASIETWYNVKPD